MKKIILAIALVCASSFALTLEDVKRDLSVNLVNPDSLEYRVHMVVSVPKFGSQATDYHYVTKGKNKVYFEMRSPFIKKKRADYPLQWGNRKAFIRPKWIRCVEFWELERTSTC